MRRYLWLISFMLMASPAMADWTGKDASGAVVTFKNPNTCTSVVCVPIAQPVDGTGAALGVLANPFSVNVIGSLPGFATTPTFNCGTGCGGGGGGSSAITAWGGATLGAATAWGTAPVGNVVIGVNAVEPTVTSTLAGTLPGSAILLGMKDGITGLLSPIIGNAATGQWTNMTTVGGASATGLIVSPSTSPVTATNPAMVTVFRPDQLLPGFASTPTFNCGAGCGGAVTNAGTFAVQATIATPSAWGINTLGSTTFGQSGQLALGAVTTVSPTYANSQSSALSLDTTGALRVNVTAGGAGGGAVFGPTAVGSANANPPVAFGGTVTGAAGQNVVGAAIKPASTAAVATDTSIVMQPSPNWPVVNTATVTAGTVGLLTGFKDGITGLFQPLIGDAATGQWVNLTSIGGTSATGTVTAASTATVATQRALASNESPNSQLSVAIGTTVDAPCTLPATTTACSDTAIQKAIANAAIGAVSAGTNTIGNFGSDPSSGKGTPAEAFLALPATATTQIIALSGSTKTYITSALVLAGGTVNVTFKYGTGTNCGTGTTTLSGPWPLTAQAGFSKGSGVGAVMIVPSGQALCITTDASVTGGVDLTYQQI